MTFDVRIHGRGGQGVVTSAELLAVAAFDEGRWAQAIPSFGSERMGAPVVAFCRISDRAIRTREPIVEPDAVVVADATLLHLGGVFDGLVPRGAVVVNSARPAGSPGLGPHGAVVATVPATELALAHVGRPVPGAALLGALSALTGVVSLGALQAAIRERFGGRIGEGNVVAAAAGYDAAIRSGARAGSPAGASSGGSFG